MRKQTGRLAKDVRGQAILEYIILLSFTLGILVFLIRHLNDGLDNTTAGIGGQLEKQIRTGSAPPSIWSK